MTTRALPPCVLGLDGETLSAWRDGLLLADESRRIAGHTPGCASCQRELGDFETITSLLNGQRAPSLRAEVWDGVRRRIMDGGQRRFFTGNGRIWGSAAAAIVVVTLVGLFAALLARGPLGEPPGSGTPGPTTTPCQTPTPFAGPTPTRDTVPDAGADPTGTNRLGRRSLRTDAARLEPRQPATPAQANAYEQLGWTAASAGAGTDSACRLRAVEAQRRLCLHGRAKRRDADQQDDRRRRNLEVLEPPDQREPSAPLP